MTLEEQVCSLDLAKKLKELGVKQESYVSWVDGDAWDHTMQSEFETRSSPPRDEWIAAFTVAELGEMLPIGYRSFRRFAGQDIVWRCEAASEHMYDRWPIETDTEADARAKMLIYLLETKRFTV